MDALFGMILLAAFIGFCFWKYPALMKEIFSFKKKPAEPVEPIEPVKEAGPPKYPGKSVSRADSLAYENISDINEPIQPVVAKVPRHEIIRHDYYKSVVNGNLWPQWTCKCGASDKEPTSVYQTLEQTQQDARNKGARHVIDANKADEMLDKSNGKFAF